jgi:hypothetical protein
VPSDRGNRLALDSLVRPGGTSIRPDDPFAQIAAEIRDRLAEPKMRTRRFPRNHSNWQPYEFNENITDGAQSDR